MTVATTRAPARCGNAIKLRRLLYVRCDEPVAPWRRRRDIMQFQANSATQPYGGLLAQRRPPKKVFARRA